MNAPRPAPAGSTSDPARETESVSVRSVAMPTEHGGWSLTAEPALLGLIVAWSWPGLALGVGAMMAFVARTPVKLVLVDQWRHRRLARTRLAAMVAAGELAILAALGLYVAVAAESGFWVPLAFAAPLIAIELWYDMRSKSRRLIPELAGSVGIGAVATAIALADGADPSLAWGLWVVIGARTLAAIPHVRTQIMRTRSRPAPLWVSDGAQVVAVAVATAAWTADLVPLAAPVALALLGLINVVAVRRPPKRPAVIGIQQMIFGVVVIAATAVAILVA